MENPEYLIHIRDRPNGNPYKAYSSWDNFCVEIYETVEGRWHGEAARRFDANRPEHYCRWREHKAGAKLIMRIHKGDLLRLEHEGTRKIMVVHRLEAAGGQFKLAPHNETGQLDLRHATDNAIDPFRIPQLAHGFVPNPQTDERHASPGGRTGPSLADSTKAWRTLTNPASPLRDHQPMR